MNFSDMKIHIHSKVASERSDRARIKVIFFNLCSVNNFFHSSSPWILTFNSLEKSFFKCSKMRFWYSKFSKVPTVGGGYPTPSHRTLLRLVVLPPPPPNPKNGSTPLPCFCCHIYIYININSKLSLTFCLHEYMIRSQTSSTRERIPFLPVHIYRIEAPHAITSINRMSLTYTGWPRKNRTGYFPQYVDTITGISVWGNFSWEKWYQDQPFWFSSIFFPTAHFVRQCRSPKSIFSLN